jgi:hypothetical protein
VSCVGLWRGVDRARNVRLAICTFTSMTRMTLPRATGTGKPPRRSSEVLCANFQSCRSWARPTFPTLTSSCHVALACPLIPPES